MSGTLVAEADGARARLLVLLPEGSDVAYATAERWTVSGGEGFWRPVGEKYTGAGVIYDESPPLNTEVTYRAVLFRDLGHPTARMLETNDDLITEPVTITIFYTGGE